MNPSAYQFDIAHATEAGTLHEYRRNIAEDELLVESEKADLFRAIDQRFSALNRAATKPAKGRWD